MEEEKDLSICVAPLHIVKSISGFPSATSPANPPNHDAQPHTIHQMTPPLTPQDMTQPSISSHKPTRPTFHNYLRAFYPFHPTASVAPSTVTLPLDAGNIILVHSIHINGWADGTLLDTGARGWLPTNYCEGYEHIPMRPLLKALTDFWDVIRHGNDATLDIFRNQDYMRGLIAGVRYLLEKSDCLTRDSPIVKEHDNIRRTRKALLSDLSSLVKIAKSLQDTACGSPLARSADEIFPEMLLNAFKIVTRGVKFLDVWNEDVGIDCAYGSVSAILGRAKSHDRPSPLTPPADSSGENANAEDSMGEKERETSLAKAIRKSRFRQTINHETSPSLYEVPPSPPRPRPASLDSKRTSIARRMTSDGHATGPTNLKLASERLRASHDVFLGCLGTFLGLHMQSRCSSELLLTTQQSVKSCRELLTVIEIVLDHDPRRSETLAEAKDAMYDNITELVHAAREVFRPVSSANEDVVFIPDDAKRLFRAARDCVRGAGECVWMSRSVLERIGDFEPEAAEIESSNATIESPRSSRRMHWITETSQADRDYEDPNAHLSSAQPAR